MEGAVYDKLLDTRWNVQVPGVSFQDLHLEKAVDEGDPVSLPLYVGLGYFGIAAFQSSEFSSKLNKRDNFTR